MKKVEFSAATLSIMINIILILILPGIKIEDAGVKKIQVGLIALEKKQQAQVKPKPAPTPKKQEVKKPEVKAPKPQPKPEPVKNFETLAKSIEAPKLDPRSMVSKSTRTQPSAPRIQEEKKLETRENKQEINNQEYKFSTDNVVVENLEIPLDNPEISSVETSDSSSELVFEKIFNEKASIEGLPSGYKIGVEDGDMMARWENSNREPAYPESAQLRGQQGTVIIRLSLDERGSVTSLSFEKGSGVPEINTAIEEIARTWKIYLSKNGLGIRGNVVLEYNFKLRGQN